MIQETFRTEVCLELSEWAQSLIIFVPPEETLKSLLAQKRIFSIRQEGWSTSQTDGGFLILPLQGLLTKIMDRVRMMAGMKAV